MQQLHPVGVTADHAGLVLSTRRGTKTGKFTVAADEKLLAMVQEARRLAGGREETAGPSAGDAAGGGKDAEEESAPAPPPPPKRVSSLSPREIQARLRAGGTVSEIAAAAGVDEEWILRFADPIRAEQAQVVERAKALTFNKPRLGLSVEPLETSVFLNLGERGVRLPADEFDAAWTAFNLHGTSWAVLFSYTSRQRRQTAQWEVDLRSGELTARNRLASDLAYVEPGRRRRRMESLEEPAPAKKAAAPNRAPALKKVPAAAKKASAPRKVPAPAKVVASKKAAVLGRGVASKNGRSPAKVVTTKKKAPPMKAVSPVPKGAARQSSSRPRRPAKKPADNQPPAPEAAATAPPAPPAPKLPERPTHLARPPSPMNLTNRSVTTAGRLAGAPSLRPPAPPRPKIRAEAPMPPPRPRSRRRPDPEDASEREAGPAFELGPGPPPAEPPAAEAILATTDGEAATGAGEQAAAPTQGAEPPAAARRRRSDRRIAPRVGEPSVVILSTPAVRRLESEEGRESKPPSSTSSS